MSFRTIGFAAVLGVATLAATAASATVQTYTDYTSWAAAVTGTISTNTTVNPADVGTSVSSVTLNDGTVISFFDGVTHASTSLQIEQPGNGWGSWTGWNGSYTGAVYWWMNVSDLEFGSSTVSAFAFEIEPDLPTNDIFVTLTLSTGDPVQLDFASVSDVKFFGWVGDGVTSVSFQSNDDFGVGNFLSVRDVAAPEPATLSLIGAGVLGMGALRRRKAKA